MAQATVEPERIRKSRERPLLPFTICTIVTRQDEYEALHRNFVEHGFTEDKAAFLYADNTAGNTFDAFEAYNIFLQEANSTYIILCHQDVLMLQDGYAELLASLDELNTRFPAWGLCGNAGTRQDGTQSIRITDPNTGENAEGGPFPAQVVALDENFIIVRRDANLAVSHDMSGFHLYGADLCIIADLLGLTAHVIDFHLLHKSGGNIDAAFYDTRQQMIAKYRRALRSRWIEVTTRRPFYVSGSRASYTIARAGRSVAWRARHIADMVKRLFER